MELMRKIKEVSIYLLIRKQGEFIKCSIRTKFDGADRIASQLFGGGGHPRAAGCKIKFDSNQPLLKQVKQIVDKILDFKI
jgi:nanoRNase/pAp phosphatase (c-di-AMP/oligoRNAs hydrolase)